jgi:hypothetical protein
MGTVAPSGTVSVKEGDDISITCTPDTNYMTDKVFLNSNSVSFSNNTYTLTNV